MIGALFVIMVVMFGMAVYKAFQIKGNWGKAVEDTVKKVADKVSYSDPCAKLKDQIKAYKLKTAELQTNTEVLRKALKEQESQRDRAYEVAKIAKERADKEDAKLAYALYKASKENCESIQVDIDNNNELYDSLVKNLRGREMLLVKFEAQQKRNAARSAANSIRRDIAKDELLEEGLFGTEFNEDICEEEVEAIAIEKLNKDLKGGDVLEKYKEVVEVDSDFEEFFKGVDA
jgi:hypothetical protein